MDNKYSYREQRKRLETAKAALNDALGAVLDAYDYERQFGTGSGEYFDVVTEVRNAKRVVSDFANAVRALTPI